MKKFETVTRELTDFNADISETKSDKKPDTEKSILLTETNSEKSTTEPESYNFLARIRSKQEVIPSKKFERAKSG